MSMTKRLIDVDDVLLNKAKKMLGAETNKETVNRALDEYVKLELRRRHIQRLSTMEGLDLNNPEVMKNSWRHGGRS
jgi:Arc/MetJ family transcription regulator